MTADPLRDTAFLVSMPVAQPSGTSDRIPLYRNRLVLLILLAGVIIRILLGWHHVQHGFVPDTNESTFWLLARRLSETGDFGIYGQHGLYLFKEPIYPFLLAGTMLIFGQTYFPLLVLQSLLGPAIGILLADQFGRSSRRAGLSERAAHATELLAAFLVILSPIAIFYDRMLMAEGMASVFLTGGFLAWLRAHELEGDENRVRAWRWIAIAGVCFGIAVLLRAAFLLIPGALLFHDLLLHRTRLWTWMKRDAAIACLMAAVVAPWTYRNYRAVGHVVPVCVGLGLTVWQGTLPMRPDFVPIYTEEEWKEALIDLEGDATVQYEQDKKLLHRGIETIRKDPIAWLKKCSLRALKFWVSSHAGYVKGGLSDRAKAFGAALSAFLAMIAVGGMIAIGYRGMRELYPYLVLPIYTMAAHFFLFNSPRYAHPAWPFLLCIGALGAVLAAGFIRERVQNRPVAERLYPTEHQ